MSNAKGTRLYSKPDAKSKLRKEVLPEGQVLEASEKWTPAGSPVRDGYIVTPPWEGKGSESSIRIFLNPMCICFRPEGSILTRCTCILKALGVSLFSLCLCISTVVAVVPV